MHPVRIGEWLYLRDSGTKLFISRHVYIFAFSYSFFFYSSCAPSSLWNAKPTGWIGARGDGWITEGERGRGDAAKGRKCERWKERFCHPVRHPPDEIKTLTLVVGKMWPRRGGGKSNGWKSRGGKSRWKLLQHSYCGLNNGTCRVSRRRKRRISRSVRNFFFNVTLECSHYDLWSSSWTISWKKRKMREKSEFSMKYYTYIIAKKRSLG